MMENLSVQLGGKSILKQINLSVPESSILGVIGPNGAGKTTLMRAISGTVPLSDGRIQFRSLDFSKLSILERARLIAVVPQARHLPGAYTCKETVMMGRTPHLNWLGQFDEQDRQLALEAMRRTGTLDMANRFIGELSGGEQQRVLLARALAQTAPILLLDEPTTHLDLQYQISLLNLIRDLVKNGGLAETDASLTVLLTLHDLNLVGQYADQVAVMVRGYIQSIGTPLDVLTPATLSPAFNIPLRSIPLKEEEKVRLSCQLTFNDQMISINLYATFRVVTGLTSFMMEPTDNLSIEKAIMQIVDLYPTLKKYLISENGSISNSVLIILNGHEIYARSTGLQTILSQGDRLDFFPPLAGG